MLKKTTSATSLRKFF